MVTEQSDERLRVFISYSRVDSEFASRLRADLEATGFATWMDPNLGSEGGQNWERMIRGAIDSCQAMVVIVSPDSAASEWVQIEYSYFLERLQDQPEKLLIPVYFRTVASFPLGLRIKQWIEFREDPGIKDSYLVGLSNLTRSLYKAPKPPKLPPIPKAPTVSPPASPPPQGRDKPVYPTVLPEPELSLEIQEWVAGVFAARGEGNLADEEYFLRKLVESDNVQIRDAYSQRLQTVIDQREQQHVAHLQQQAREAVAARQWVLALGAWQAIQALRPHDRQSKEGVRQARTEYAKEALSDGRFDEAVGAWQALVREYPQTQVGRDGLRTALFARADDAWRMGDWTRAAESWEVIRTLPPTHEDSAYNSDWRREKEAAKYLKAIEENQHESHRYQTAQRLLAAGDASGARAALEETYKAAPNYGDPAGIAAQVAVDVPKTLVDKESEIRAVEEPKRVAYEAAAKARAARTAKANAAKARAARTAKANASARARVAEARKVAEQEAKRAKAWYIPAGFLAIVYCPINYLAAAITTAVHAGDWWTGTMYTNSTKLAWMSLLLAGGLFILCQIIVLCVGGVINARSYVLQFSMALFFAIILAIPGCWVVALWLYTGFQQNIDPATLGILVFMCVGGVAVAIVLRILGRDGF